MTRGQIVRYAAAASIALAVATWATWPSITASWRLDDLRERCRGDARKLEACSTLLADPAASDEDRAGAYFARAIAYAERRDFAHALADHDASIRLMPTSVAAVFNRGFTHRYAGHDKEALADFNHVLKMLRGETSERAARAWINRAYVESRLGDDAHAVPDAERALAMAPGAEEVLTFHSQVALRNRRYEAALEDVDKLVKMNPRDASNYDDRCFFGALAGRGAGVLADCARAIALDPKRADFVDTRGFARYSTGDYKGAIADFDLAMTMKPRFASPLFMRGLAKRRIGDASGDGDIAQAERLDPKIAGNYAVFGVVP